MGTKLGWGGLADWAVRWGQGALLGLLAISGAEHVSAAQTLVPVTGGDDGFRLVKVAEGLEHPWGLASLPDGNFLVTERPGRLRLIRNGVVDPQPIAGLPEIASVGQGGCWMSHCTRAFGRMAGYTSPMWREWGASWY